MKYTKIIMTMLTAAILMLMTAGLATASDAGCVDCSPVLGNGGGAPVFYSRLSATTTAEPTATPLPDGVEVQEFITYAAEQTAQPAPTAIPGRLAGMVIGIDPGHQSHANRDKEPLAPGSSELKAKVSSGTQGVKTRINEYETNLTIALKLRARLEAEGAKVIMTRETHDVDISNVERAQLMNAAGVDIWLRVHCNGSDNGSVNGMGMYVRENGACAEESYAAGQLLLDEMSAITGAKANGVHKSDTYTGNNWSEVPCVLVEMGYMSNADEDEKLNDDNYQNLLVEGYVNALERWNKLYNGLNIAQPENNGVID